LESDPVAALDSAKETFCATHLGVEGNFDDSSFAFVRTNRPRPPVAKKNWPTIGAPVTSVIPAPPTSRADRAIARERIAPSPRSEDDET